jgi:hypothetical protein
VLAIAVAAHNGFLLCHRASLYTHYGGYFGSYLCAAGHTLVYGCTVHNGLGVVGTTGVAAGAAVSARQARGHQAHALVLFYAHKVSRYDKNSCAQKANYGYYNRC